MTKKTVPLTVEKVKTIKSLDVVDHTPDPFPKKFFATSIVGSRFAGKSNLIVWMILNIYHKLYDTILILSPSAYYDKIWTSCHKLRNIAFSNQCNNEVLDSILEKQKIIYTQSNKKSHLLIVIDDFGVQSGRSSNGGHRASLEKIACTGRHFGISMFNSYQHAFQMTPTVRLNSTNVMLFRLNLKEFRKLSEEFRCHLTEEEFLNMAQEATREKFHFLYLNFQTEIEKDMFTLGFV